MLSILDCVTVNRKSFLEILHLTDFYSGAAPGLSNRGGKGGAANFAEGQVFMQPNPYTILCKLFKQIIYLINPNHNFLQCNIAP